MSKQLQKISPFLWFDTQAEEAVKFYTSIFKDSSIGAVTYYSELGPGPKGSVMTIGFQLEGQQFVALNGGAALQIYGSCIVRSELRKPGRSGSFLGQAVGRRTRGTVWLGERQVRLVLADRSHRPAQAVSGQGPGAIEASDAGDASNEEARHSRFRKGLSGIN
jgi:hypothetical protein